MAKGDREHITLACTECRARNYHTRKNRRNDPERLELRKFCRRCRTHSHTARRGRLATQQNGAFAWVERCAGSRSALSAANSGSRSAPRPAAEAAAGPR